MKCLKYAFILLIVHGWQSGFAQNQNQQKAIFMQSRIDSVAVGHAIPDFTMLSESLEEVNFSSFLGKTVVIDVWATCCKPCILLSPWFEKENKINGAQDVIFISFSVDEQQGKWINYTQNHKVNHDRYWIGDDKENPIKWLTFEEFEISTGRTVWDESIPKFVIVNKDGVVKALKFGQLGMPPFRRAVKKALKD
ncbi:MAG: thiol-disulfide isomerase/thioredoxin [Vicingaceae bacterium]|jgi:thiol-disulfide isomerase/thioredoxin